MSTHLERLRELVAQADPIRRLGRVRRVVGGMVEAEGLDLMVGDLCELHSQNASASVLAEAVGFRDERVFLMPLGALNGIGPGSYFEKATTRAEIPVGDALLGRVLDAFGQPLDDKGPVLCHASRPYHGASVNPLQRVPIREPLSTGVRGIDGPMACGKGQRLGIFAGSGVGKSVLMGMIARNTSADINVIALIGERGREIREFVEQNLQEEGLRRSVVIAVPSDRSQMEKIYGSLAATSIAEYFCGRDRDVMLMLDSSTRIAMALREVGLGMGEAPTSRGYTPSVFAFLPKLLERAGHLSRGSITAFYTVLVEGDDMDEPVADTMRSLLDGHIVLSRALASQNHYPSIDVLQSISRCMVDVATDEHQSLASRLKETMAVYRDAEDLIKIGAYTKGNQPKVDHAIEKIDAIHSFLRQPMNEKSSFADIVPMLKKIFIKPAGRDS